MVKLVALLVLMAQMGSYVPAKSMSLSLHDTILTRMGVSLSGISCWIPQTISHRLQTIWPPVVPLSWSRSLRRVIS